MDEPTIVIQQPPEVVEVPAEPSVPEVLGAAAAVIDMSNSLAQANAPVDHSFEILTELRAMNSKLDSVIAMQSAPAPVIVEVEPPEPEPEPTPEIVVAAGDVKKEEITETIPKADEEAPRSRKRRFI